MKKKHRIIRFFLLLLPLLSLYASAVGEENKVLTIHLADRKIKIDGRLDEDIYRSLTPVRGFSQFHPQNGAEPTFQTEVYSYYDKHNLYFAFRCFDNEPGKINADITPFGEYENNDQVRIYLDTFSDKRTYDTFAVNPRGIKKGKQTVWEADAVITSWGWSAEFQIPFKSLRFPVREEQHWAVNFERIIFRLNETLYWTRVPRDKINILADTFAKLEGIHDIKGGHNLEIFPYAGYRDSYSGAEQDNKLAFGMDLKYGITSNLTMDLTTSPDYSDVESDPFFFQLTPYEYSLNENRPFYTEGSNYFYTTFNLFYSRRISHPILAAKITGQEKGFSVGFLAARNNDSGLDRYHGVFRLQKNIFKLSNIGMIYTSIEEENNWNRNIGFDFKFKIKDIYTIAGMAAFAFNKDYPRGDNGMYRLQMSRAVEKGFSFTGVFLRVEPEVYVPAGFIPKVDYQEFKAIGKYIFRWEGKWLEKLNLMVWKINENEISSGLIIQDTYELVLGLSTKNRIEFTTAYFVGKFRPTIFNADGDLAPDEVLYPSKFFSAEIYYTGSRFVQFGVLWVMIHDFVYNDDFTDALAGKTNDGSLWIDFKLSPQLRLHLDYRNVNYYSIDRSIRFNGGLVSTGLIYQASKQISSFLAFQYDAHAHRFQYDLLIGYEPANVSKICLSIKNYSENRFRLFDPDARSVTFKISYLLRF